MATSLQLDSDTQATVRVQEQYRLLDAQQAPERRAAFNLPYDPQHPPCHIRIKQAIVIGGIFIGGVVCTVMGVVLMGRVDKGDLLFSLGFGLQFVGNFIIFCTIIWSCHTFACSPVERNVVDLTYQPKVPCIPCITPPCDTCHCTETTIEV